MPALVEEHHVLAGSPTILTHATQLPPAGTVFSTSFNYLDPNNGAPYIMHLEKF